MKKHIMILAVFAFLITGCSYSNWNLGNPAPQPSEQPHTKSQPLDDGGFTTEAPVTDSGTGVVEVTNGAGSTQTTNKENMFHIDTIISTWGEPNTIRTNPLGEKVYVWKNCRTTGQYVEKCNESSCETVPETVCCDRKLITNSEGYVINLKQAIAECM